MYCISRPNAFKLGRGSKIPKNIAAVICERSLERRFGRQAVGGAGAEHDVVLRLVLVGVVLVVVAVTVLLVVVIC